MANLIVHIGAPKTGTTAIQQYLLKNRDALARQGVLYPMGGLYKSGHHVIGAAIFPGRGNRLEGVSRDEALARSLEQIRTEIARQAPHTVILSTEYLWGELSAANVQRLLKPFADHSVKVIAYLRRQDLLAQSLYVQAVKGGLTDAFPVWLERVVDSEKAGFNFHKVLTCWKESGTQVELNVRVYERSQLTTDICSDFLSAACPGVTLPPNTDRVANTGPDPATVELLRLVSGKIADPELATSVRKLILTRSPARPLFAPLSYLSTEEANSLLARFAEQNAMIARDFLNKPDGILFREPVQTGKPADAGTPEPQVVLDRLASLLPELLNQREKRPPAVQPNDIAVQRKKRPADRMQAGRKSEMSSL
jgi:hypothetical protein